MQAYCYSEHVFKQPNPEIDFIADTMMTTSETTFETIMATKCIGTCRRSNAANTLSTLHPFPTSGACVKTMAMTSAGTSWLCCTTQGCFLPCFLRLRAAPLCRGTGAYLRLETSPYTQIDSETNWLYSYPPLPSMVRTFSLEKQEVGASKIDVKKRVL